MPDLSGHQRGAQTMHTVVEHLIGRVQYLTVWGFSTDNWKRSDKEVSSLFNLLALQIEKDTPWLHSRGVRLRHIGRLHELSNELQLAGTNAMELTKDNTGMTFTLAFNYSGRAEIVDAVRGLIADGRLFEPAVTRPELDEKLFSRYLYTNDLPDVDLVIRTAGEFRLSNFLLWQTAHSEFYFTPTLWPDFNREELEKALRDYSERERRFGGD